MYIIDIIEANLSACLALGKIKGQSFNVVYMVKKCLREIYYGHFVRYWEKIIGLPIGQDVIISIVMLIPL